MITLSSALTPKDLSAKCKAAVPLWTAKESLIPKNFENLFWNIFVFSPLADSQVVLIAWLTYFFSRDDKFGLLTRYLIKINLNLIIIALV